MAAAIFARLALVEARRSGLAWLALVAVAAGVAAGAFLAQVALTESLMVQTAVVAALLRTCAVFILAAQVIASVRREIDERRLEMMLSLPLSRSAQYLGRLAGFAACGLVLASVFAAPLALWAPASAVAAWALSLALELVLVAAAALFFSMTLAQVVPALAATAGLYLLGRSIGALQAIAAGPLTADTTLQQLGRHAIDLVALAVPALDRVTRTEWLLYGPPDARAYGAALAGLVLYTALLGAAGVFDFQRRSA